MSTVVKDLGAVSAYAYAVEKGYTGTEAEFAELMADYAAVGQRAEDAANGASASAAASAQSAAAAGASEQGCARAVQDAVEAAVLSRIKAEEAQTSAQTASSKASEASQSASQASGYAQTAETAKTDAQTAKTQAESARDSAITAKIAAETAQGKAETAAQNVSESAAQIQTNKEDITELKNTLKPIFSDNLLHLTEMVDGYYYYGGKVPSASYCYFIVSVESGKTYRYNCVRFGSTASTGKINTQNYGLLFADSYTADYTGDFYVSVPKNRLADAFFCEEKDYSVVAPIKYSDPRYNTNALAQEYGLSKDIPVSQYGLSKVFPVADGTDLRFTGIQYADKYMYVDSDNKAKFYNSTAFGVYIIPATEGHYTFSIPARFVIASDSYGNSLLYLGGTGAYSTQIDCPSGTEYLCVSFKTVGFPTAKIGRGYETPTETKLSDSALKSRTEQLENKLYGKGFYKQTGILADGESWNVPIMNVKKNNVYSFMAKVETLGEIAIGHGVNVYNSSYIIVDNTNVTVHRFYSQAESVVYPHGLTISDYLYIQIIVKVGTATINLYSNGKTFTQDVQWNGDGAASSYVKNNGSVLSDCTFTWSCADFRKATWMFGNSYFGMTTSQRWVKYLIQAGYGDNVLINAYPGENSVNAFTALTNMIGAFGVPHTLIWCLGMNDGSDGDVNTPSTAWMTAINKVKGVCDAYGIDLILATIPTVPTINHNGKNAHVKTSGYRYIDFASAVGADGTGAWYTDMLSSDGVHPTEKGAKALYYQAIADAPEITYD